MPDHAAAGPAGRPGDGGGPEPAPLEIVRYAMRATSLEPALRAGELVDARGARARGGVTQVVAGDVVEAARRACARPAAGPPAAFEAIKAGLKGLAVARARGSLESLRNAFVEAWDGAEARRRLGEARARLGA